MIGLIDAGNTRVKWQLLDVNGEKIVNGVFTHSDSSAAEFKQNLATLFMAGDRQVKLSKAAISCVGSDVLQGKLASYIKNELSVESYIAKVEKTACGITNGYDDISLLGVDRWLAVIGARNICETGDIIVIDAGTAVTVDYLDESDLFCGGVIFPGFELIHNSLVSSTSKIQSKQCLIQDIIGKTTTECVNSGVYFGLAGALERIVKEMQKKTKLNTTILMCGGASPTLKKIVDKKVFKNAQLSENLVLNGLLKVMM